MLLIVIPTRSDALHAAVKIRSIIHDCDE